MPRHPMLARAYALSSSGQNAEAVLIINQLVAQNEPEALYTLGEMKWRGGMVPQDPVQARLLFQRAAEAGHVISGFYYTNLLASGLVGPRNWSEALRRLRNESARDTKRRRALALVERMELTGTGDPCDIPESRVLSRAPDVRLIERLFTAMECEYLREVANPLFTPSVVFDEQRRQVRDPIRTSDGSTIHWLIEDPAVHALNRRLAAATETSADQGEALQILRYRPGQQYRNHLDFVQTTGNVRRQTALVYLNHDYKGGETCFVKVGLKVKGRKGDALLFRNALADGHPDPLSEHAGLPVSSGTKFLASRWIRESRWTPPA